MELETTFYGDVMKSKLEIYEVIRPKYKQSLKPTNFTNLNTKSNQRINHTTNVNSNNRYPPAIHHRYSSIFKAMLPNELPPSRIVDHKIELLPGSKPTSRPPYWLSLHKLQELRTQLNDLLETGKIRPSKSPFGAPVLFIKKKNRKDAADHCQRAERWREKAPTKATQSLYKA
jgi:hypothetical protein